MIGWFALILQYWLLMTGDVGPDPIHRTINFFSYFTILANLIGAISMTVPLLAPGTALGAFFKRSSTRTVVTTFFVVVGLTYHFILADLADLEGWNKIADTILHYVLPALFVLDWLLFVPKAEIPWPTTLGALVFPVLYMVWTYVHGEWTGFYPYPFVDVSKLGIEKVLMNAAGMIAAFAAICLILTAVGRTIGATERASAD